MSETQEQSAAGAEPEPKRVPRIPRARIERVRELYLQGVPNLAIQSQLSKEFVCTCRTIRRYIKIVCEKLGRTETAHTEAARAQASEMLLEAYQLAKHRTGCTKDGVSYDDPDVKAMVAAAHRYAELHGAVGPKRIEHSGPNGAPLGAMPVVFAPSMKPE